MPALAPNAFSNRVGTLIVAGGSSTNAAYGNVSLNLIGATETWANVLTNNQITGALADDADMAFFIRCPRGVWTDSNGDEWINHCNANGVPVYVPGPYHAKTVAAGRAGGVRLTQGFSTFLAGLQGGGSPITVYNNCTPNAAHPTTGVLENWQLDPLTQTGYVTLANVTDLAAVRAMYADELDYGVTEFAFDGTGQDRSAYMLSNTLFPLLATATGALATFANEYDRWVCAEAAPVVATASWLSPYSFCATYDGFNARLNNPEYLQPADMGLLPCVLIQGSTAADYAHALALAPYYRVRVKWVAMKAVMGQTAMDELLAAGAGTVEVPEETAATTLSLYPVGRGAWGARRR